MARQSARLTTRVQRPAAEEPDSQEEPKIGFFESLAQFTTEEWRGMKMYVYRLWPVIDRKEKEHFLSKLQEPCAEDFLLSTFGSGKYYLRLNNKQGNTIASHTVSVYNQQHPPRVNPEEVVVSDPENDRYFKTWGKPQPATLGDSSSAVADLARMALNEGNRRPSLDPQILGLWEKTNAERDNLAQRLVEMAQKQPPASAVEPITMLREMLGVMREIQPPVPPAASIDQIADAVATRLGVVGRGAGGGDPFSHWEKVQAFLERAGGVAPAVNPEGPGGGVAGDVSSSWAPHIANIISEARAFVPELMQAWFAVRSSSAPAAVPDDGALEILPLDKRIETIFKAGFESMRRGVTGQQFAQWLCLSGEMPGGLEAFNILKPAGAGGLVAMAATNPLGAQIVNDAGVRPQLDRFLADFFSFNPAGSAAASAA